MKKSYIKLITFSSFIILLCILNSFLLKKFNTSLLVIFTLILLVITKFTFGFEKDRHRYIKDIILEIIIDLIAFFLLFYLSGIIIGFARVDNYLTTKAMLDIIILLIVYIIIKEYLRYTLITKASESKALMILMTITIIFLDNTIAFSMSSLTISKDTFLLIALTFIPSIAENILCSWITYHFGYKPNIVYLLIIKLYSYLLPIIPNPNEYVYSIIFFLLPIIILLKLRKWYLKDRVDEEVERVKRKQIIYYLPIITLVIILVYLVSGYFKYHAIAIATGSMEPNYYNKKYILLPITSIKKNNSNYAIINKDIDIDYEYYNTITSEFKSQYGVETSSVLNVSFIVYNESTDLNLSPSITTISIPLSQKSININMQSTDTVNNNKQELTKYVFALSNACYLCLGVICTVLAIVFAIKTIRLFTKSFTKKNNYDKYLGKILKEYDRLIVETAYLPKFNDYNIIKINKFSELLDVRDNLKLPIMYYNVVTHQKCHLYILKDNNLYLLTLKDIDL